MRPIPTINALYTAILTDLEGQFSIVIPVLGKSFLRGFAAVQAAKLKLIYLMVGYLQKNIFVDTADSEANGGTLERFGRVKIGRNPNAAVPGEYTIQVKGTVGAIITASTTFKSNDGSLNVGVLYVLDNNHTLVSTTDTVLLRALTSGIEGKLSIGDQLTATSPIANVDSIATVTVETIPPIAAEDIEAYRLTVLQSYQLEPEGGSAADYIIWSKQTPGVRSTYPYARSGANNEINLFIESELVDSVDSKGTPTGAMLAAVEANIEDGLRPLGVFEVHYLPVTVKNVDITINGYVGRTEDIETLINNSLVTLVSAIRPFINGVDTLATKNNILDINRIVATILNELPGSSFTSIVLEIDSVPLSTYTFTDGNIPFLNTPITFV